MVVIAFPGVPFVLLTLPRAINIQPAPGLGILQFKKLLVQH